MLRAFTRNRAALLALAGLLLCLCYTMSLPQPEADLPANPLPDDPDARYIDRILRQPDLSQAKIGHRSADQHTLRWAPTSTTLHQPRWIEQGSPGVIVENPRNFQALLEEAIPRLRFDSYTPYTDADPLPEEAWMKQHGGGRVLCLYPEGLTRIQLHIWEDTDQVWVSLFRPDGTGAANWAGYSVYRPATGYDVAQLLRQVEFLSVTPNPGGPVVLLP